MPWFGVWKIGSLYTKDWGFPGGTSGKEPACQCRRRKIHGFDPWFRKIPWKRAWQPTPVFLPGESHGQRSLAGYSPWSNRKSDPTEQPTHTLTRENVTSSPGSFCQCMLRRWVEESSEISSKTLVSWKQQLLSVCLCVCSHLMDQMLHISASNYCLFKYYVA